MANIQLSNETRKEVSTRDQEAAVAFPTRMPHDVNLEESILGALLIERDALADVVDVLQPESFYREANQHIYRAIRTLFNQGTPIDPHTVAAQLKRDDTLEKVGGTACLARLTERVISREHMEYHARIILQMAIRRNLIGAGNTLKRNASDLSQDTFEVLETAERAIYNISANIFSQQEHSIATVLHDCFNRIEERSQNGGVSGTSSGFPDLDRLMGGWKPKEMVVVAARPGMGKTALLLDFARHAAVTRRVPVAFFSLEMGSEGIGDRLVSSCSGVSSFKISNEVLKEEEYRQAYEGTKELAQTKLFIEDKPQLSILEFRSLCRRLKSKHKVQLAFVDYLQLMKGGEVRNNGNREQQVAAISRGLKATAMELEITVVVAAQLSRAVETRGGDKRPQLADLRESGAIEQDADKVLFLYRDEYYGVREDEEGEGTHGQAELIVAKHRNGPTGKAKVLFDANTMSFRDKAVSLVNYACKRDIEAGPNSGKN